MAEMFKGLQEKIGAMATFASAAVHESMDTARAGKKLLDDGGEPAVQALLAKKVATDAAALDAQVLAHIKSVVDKYDDAFTKLAAVSSAAPVVGITGYDEFEELMASYKERAKTYRDEIKMLETNIPKPPTSTKEEDDATVIVQVKSPLQSHC